MPLILEIVTPEKRAYNNLGVERVKLPTVEGEIEVLPGHIPLVCMVHPGEVRIDTGSGYSSIAIDKGFAEIYGDKISILTEGAIDVQDIDLEEATKAEQRALEAIRKAQKEDMDPAEIEKLESIVRFSLAQKLLKKNQ
jgi:F-type H+-transporting ATPase subunit epsilon